MDTNKVSPFVDIFLESSLSRIIQHYIPHLVSVPACINLIEFN